MHRAWAALDGARGIRRAGPTGARRMLLYALMAGALEPCSTRCRTRRNGATARYYRPTGSPGSVSDRDGRPTDRDGCPASTNHR
ncbi:hypothetical protein NKH77_51365 [Streptomyces sp. M19]